jgi:hypothetical protein
MRPLQLNSVIGFAGQLPEGLLCLNDGRTLVYALGSTIVLRDKVRQAADIHLHRALTA